MAKLTEETVLSMTEEGVKRHIEGLFTAYPSGIYPANLGEEMDSFLLYRNLPEETIAEYFHLVQLRHYGKSGANSGAMLEILRTDMGALARRSLQDPFKHLSPDTPGMQNVQCFLECFQKTFQEPLTGTLYGRICYCS